MKLRYIVIIFTLSILGLFFVGEYYIFKNSYSVVDMTNLNDVYKDIEKQINNDEPIKDIEEKYNCQIISLEDTSYKSLLNEAISKGKVVLDYYDKDNIAGKIVLEGINDNYELLVKNLRVNLSIVLVSILLIGYIFFYIIYKNLIRPFKTLEDFAVNVAKGELDKPLTINKENYFGAFTEGFDLMREELKKAREGEYRANISKKDLVASLSHDIKTPVATIEAICEILSVKLKEKDTLEKIEIINSKAEVIDKLISNMFHATLEELQCLSINKEEYPSLGIMAMLKKINHFNKIIFENEIPSCLVYADELRLNQVIDNIINNSYKYANTDIHVSFKEEREGISITIADEGKGVNEEDLPLLTQKYYRGDNTEGKSGSGLGLFLAKLFMEGMEGALEIYSEKGFVVVLYLKKV